MNSTGVGSAAATRIPGTAEELDVVLEAGANFIGKPFSVEALTAKVRAVLDAKPPVREPPVPAH